MGFYSRLARSRGFYIREKNTIHTPRIARARRRRRWRILRPDGTILVPGTMMMGAQDTMVAEEEEEKETIPLLVVNREKRRKNEKKY